MTVNILSQWFPNGGAPETRDAEARLSPHAAPRNTVLCVFEARHLLDRHSPVAAYPNTTTLPAQAVARLPVAFGTCATCDSRNISTLPR